MASPSTAKKAVKCFTLFCAAVCAYAKYNITPKSPNTATAVIILFFNCLPSYFSVFQAFSHAISCLYGGIVVHMDHCDLVQSQNLVKLRKHTFVIIHQIISGIVHMAGVKAYPQSVLPLYSVIDHA